MSHVIAHSRIKDVLFCLECADEVTEPTCYVEPRVVKQIAGHFSGRILDEGDLALVVIQGAVYDHEEVVNLQFERFAKFLRREEHFPTLPTMFAALQLEAQLLRANLDLKVVARLF